MLDAGHDLNFPSYPNQIGLGLDLAFLYRLDRHFLPGLLVYPQLNLAVSTLTELLDDVEPGRDKANGGKSRGTPSGPT